MTNRRNSSFIFILLFIGLLTGLVLTQANPYLHYPSRDGGSFNYIGSLILKGKMLYLDAWDSKPPGIFYLNALGLWLGRGTRWGIWLLEFIFLSAAAYCGYLVIRQLFTPGAAIFGTVLWFLMLNKILSGGNFTEEYPLLFNFFALFIFMKSLENPRKWIFDFLLGLTLGLSFLFRANNIGVQFTIFLVLFVLAIVKKEWKLFFQKMAFWVLAVLLIWGSVCLYFWAHHALSAMIQAAFIYNFSYSEHQANFLSNIVPAFEGWKINTFIALIGYGCSIYLFVMQVKKHRLDAFTLYLILGWPVEIALSSLSGRGYGHYFISWLPCIALLSGCAYTLLSPYIIVENILNFINKRTVLALSALIILTVIIFRTDLNSYIISFQRILTQRSEGIQATLDAAEYLRNHTSEDDTVLAWGGQSGINFMAKRDSPTAYLFYPGYVATSPIATALSYGYLEDITTKPPIYIIDAYIDDPDSTPSIDPQTRTEQMLDHKDILYHPSYLHQVFSFIEKNYKLEIVINNYGIYKIQENP